MRIGCGVPFALGAGLAAYAGAACGGRNTAVPSRDPPASFPEADRTADGPHSDLRVCFQMAPGEMEQDLPARLLQGNGYWAVTGTYLDCRWAESGGSGQVSLRITRDQGALKLWVQSPMSRWRICDTVGEVHVQASGLLVTAAPRGVGSDVGCRPLYSDLNCALDLVRTYAIHGDCVYLLDGQGVPLLELAPVQDPKPTLGQDVCPDFNSLTTWPGYAVPGTPGPREVADAVRDAAGTNQREVGQRRLTAACAAGSVEACVAGAPLPRPTIEDGLSRSEDPRTIYMGPPWPKRSAAQIARDSWPDWPPVQCTGEADWAEDCTVVMHPYCAGYLPIRAAERLDLYACMRAGCTCTAPASLERQFSPRLLWAHEASRWEVVWIMPNLASTATPSQVRLEITEGPGPQRPGWLRLSPLGIPWEPADPSASPPALAREMYLVEWILGMPEYRDLDWDSRGRLRIQLTQSYAKPTIAVRKLGGPRSMENGR